MKLVYKILTPDEWENARQAGLFLGSAVDLADGFIHLSSAEQVAETLSKHFKDALSLVLVAINAERMGAALCWERSRSAALFPHLYGVLSLSEVLWAQPFDPRDAYAVSALRIV